MIHTGVVRGELFLSGDSSAGKNLIVQVRDLLTKRRNGLLTGYVLLPIDVQLHFFPLASRDGLVVDIDTVPTVRADEDAVRVTDRLWWVERALLRAWRRTSCQSYVGSTPSGNDRGNAKNSSVSSAENSQSRSC
jgi:hypothetical protein